jgi:2-oxoisovalerate dehydrogenase E2 component (dihydrolipoyl transacylase)
MVPQIVIGAVGRMHVLPRYNGNGELVPRHISYMSWSGDHRVLDGAIVARFNNLFRWYIEQPQCMLLNTR